MLEHHHVKNLGDVGASTATCLALLSQWAQLLTPIFTLVLTFLGIVWWCIRFGEWLAEPNARSIRDEDEDEDGVHP